MDFKNLCRGCKTPVRSVRPSNINVGAHFSRVCIIRLISLCFVVISELELCFLKARLVDINRPAAAFKRSPDPAQQSRKACPHGSFAVALLLVSPSVFLRRDHCQHFISGREHVFVEIPLESNAAARRKPTPLCAELNLWPPNRSRTLRADTSVYVL